jgi:glucose dehydrogenase
MHSRRKAVGTWRWSLSILASCLAVTFALPARAAGVTDEMIQNDAKTPGDVLSYGMSPQQHRFSPLAKINAQNVKRLVPAWTSAARSSAASRRSRWSTTARSSRPRRTHAPTR